MDDTHDLISMEEILGLPSDPKAAFIEFERICRGRMTSLIKGLRNDESDSDIRLDYMGRVRAAAHEFAVDGAKGLTIPVSSTYSYDYYRNFFQAIVTMITQLQIRDARRSRHDSVKLIETDKSKIEHHINQIRLRLDKSNLDDSKKALIKKRLNALEAALNDKRLDLAKTLILIASVTTIVNQAEGALIKLPQAISAIMQVVGLANEKEKGAIPQIEHKSPMLAIEAKAPEVGKNEPESFERPADDDEIPF